MSTRGRLRVIVRSRKVPVRTIEVPRYLGIPFGASTQLYVGKVVLFEEVLDEEQLSAVNEARSLSSNLGLDLEVVDIAKMNPLGRFLSGFLHDVGDGPALEISPIAQAASGVNPKRQMPKAARHS